MKTHILSWFGLLAGLWLAGCQKDEIKAVVQPGAAPTLQASSSTLTLQSTDAAKDAVTFSWGAVDYGYPAAVTYTLQFDKKGNNFKAPIEVGNANSLKKTFSVADFNTMLINLGVLPGVSGQIEARIKSDVSPSVASVMSAATTITGTMYGAMSLYVPGDYQGWAPDKAPKIVSVKGDKNYEGYVYFPNASTAFKLTDAPNWTSGIFGDKSGGTSGLIASPGDNFKATGAGYYLLKADLTANKWSALKTTWGLIGSATPTGWDSDSPMTYDATKGVWTITVNLVKGDIKFRANGAWDLNYGDGDSKNNKPADGSPDVNGDNIAVPADGKYTVILNLSTAGNYTYSVAK